jgi:hypothetical protein
MKPIWVPWILVGLAALTPAQMEMRATNLYDPVLFAATAPTVNSLAPDLQLETLDGQPWRLASHTGRPVVLIKGSFT